MSFPSSSSINTTASLMQASDVITDSSTTMLPSPSPTSINTITPFMHSSDFIATLTATQEAEFILPTNPLLLSELHHTSDKFSFHPVPVADNSLNLLNNFTFHPVDNNLNMFANGAIDHFQSPTSLFQFPSYEWTKNP